MYVNLPILPTGIVSLHQLSQPHEGGMGEGRV